MGVFMTYNIVFDIDQTLAFHSVNSLEQGNFIREKGAILSQETLKTHYIYPGAIELIKLLFQSDEFKVSFFSKGTADRNLEFVRLLLDCAIEEHEFELKKSQVRVLSREDLEEAECERCRRKHYEMYGQSAGYSPKDISKVLYGDERIENAVLIDDKFENATFDQVPNFIQMPLVESRDYDALILKKRVYDASGVRNLKCMMNFSHEVDIEENVVEDGRRIIIYKTDDSFEIKFIDFDNICHIEKISNNTNLFIKLSEHYELYREDGGYLSDIEDEEAVNEICDFVEKFNGRSRKICRRANRICYLTGLLFAALSYAKAQKTSLSDALFEFQFTLREDKKTYISNFDQLVKDDRLYFLGLEKLKEVNKDFEFVTPASYCAYAEIPISDETRSFLQKAKDNEFKL